jgi:hypothetical protein
VLLRHACNVAGEYGCYREMLTARAKEEGALRFCGRALSRNDKTAFIKWDEKNVTE